MKFYRVKPKADQLQVWKVDEKRNRLICDGYVLVGNELYTEKELTKMFATRMIKATFEDTFEEISISKRNTYWFFGCRFENEQTREWEVKE